MYLRRTAEALADCSDVVVAAPSVTLADLQDLSVHVVDLGSPRPPEDLSRPLRQQSAERADAEIAHLQSAIAASRCSRAVHMYSDPVMRRLLRRPPFSVPVHTVLFFPMAHYRSLFGDDVALKRQLAARAREVMVLRWMQRSDAGTVLTLDPFAAARWNRGRRSAAWFPEPPVPAHAGDGTHRTGCVTYGALSRLKGLGRIADALSVDGEGLAITLAGPVQPDLEPEVDGLVQQMRSGGASVITAFERHTEQEGLARLRAARAAVLPYPRTKLGMSRVLLEAAAVGTPIVTDDFGLLGHLVRTFDLGETVDADDPAALAAALRRVTMDGPERYADALHAYAEKFGAGAFRDQLRSVLAS